MANYRVLERILQKSGDKKRADLIKRGGLSEAFDESGTLRTDFLRSLGENVTDGQTDAPAANEAQGAKLAAMDKRYVTPGLFYQQRKIGEDIAKINERRRSYADGANAAEVRLFDGELSEQGMKNYKQAKRMFSSLSGKSGGKLQMAILDSAAGTLGVNMGDTVYISAATLEDGRYVKTMIEEVTHFAQGTEEHGRLARFLGENEDLLEAAESELLAEGNPYGFTEENVLDDGARAEEYNNELAAHMAAKLLDDKTYINRLVRQDSSLAEKVMLRLSDMGSAIARLTDKQAQQQYRRVKQASQMFEDAVTSAGWRYVNGAIEKEDEEPNFSIKDGIVHIDTDQEIFKGVEKENVGKVVRDYMKQRFRGTTVEDVAFAKRAEREYTSSRDTQRLYNKSEQRYDAKMRASTELDNLIRSATLIRHEDSKHTKGFNAGGYDRYHVYFVLNGQAYDGEMLIVDGDEGRQFYDIVKIKESTVPYSRASDEQTSPSVGSSTLDNSIAQNSEKSTPSGNFSLEKVGEGANQQTSDDIDALIKSAGIEGEATEIREELVDLYARARNIVKGAEDDADLKKGKEFVERVAKRIAGNMARDVDGETREEMAERLRREILSGTEFSEQEAEAPKEPAKDEPKPKKTGYTYDDVHGMMDAVKKILTFETSSGLVVEGKIYRNDAWEVNKKIYQVLKAGELRKKSEVAPTGKQKSPPALFYMRNYTKCKFCIIKGSKISNFEGFVRF